MIDAWVGHYHGRADNPVGRWPAALKLGSALVIILGTALAPWRWWGWFAAVALLLLLVAWLSRIPARFLLKRLALLSPLVLGVALVNALQPVSRSIWWVVAARSALCLLTVILVSNTTPFGKILRVLQQVRIPALLISTLALMHRYLFVLAEEAERMRRARASRTFSPQRRVHWQALASVLSQLFIRASERAERIYAAMCARGWR
jgi:cobalt/nickel transport system permease protein